jgi:hypothetical protein
LFVDRSFEASGFFWFLLHIANVWFSFAHKP